MTQEEALQRLNVRVDLIPAGSSNRPGTRIQPTFITIHNTANNKPGADASMHAQYVKSADARKRQVSWHFTVDDRQVFKHLPTNEKGWHAGPGNSQSIGIEVCEHQGIDKAAALDRAALLTALMMLAYGIPRERVVTHKSWTNKDCPRVLLREPGGFDAFRSRAAAYLAQLGGGPGAGVAPGMGFGMGQPPVADFETAEAPALVDDISMLADVAEPPVATDSPAGFAPAPLPEEDRVAQLERLVGQLTLEVHNLRRALAGGQDDAGFEAD